MSYMKWNWSQIRYAALKACTTHPQIYRSSSDKICEFSFLLALAETLRVWVHDVSNDNDHGSM